MAGCEPRLSTAKANCPQWMMVINDLIPGSCFYALAVYAICIRGNVITGTWRVGGHGRACCLAHSVSRSFNSELANPCCWQLIRNRIAAFLYTIYQQHHHHPFITR